MRSRNLVRTPDERPQVLRVRFWIQAQPRNDPAADLQVPGLAEFPVRYHRLVGRARSTVTGGHCGDRDHRKRPPSPQPFSRPFHAVRAAGWQKLPHRRRPLRVARRPCPPREVAPGAALQPNISLRRPARDAEGPTCGDASAQALARDDCLRPHPTAASPAEARRARAARGLFVAPSLSRASATKQPAPGCLSVMPLYTSGTVFCRCTVSPRDSSSKTSASSQTASSSPGPPSVRWTSIADSTTIVTISFSVILSALFCVSASPRLCVKIRISPRRQVGSARKRSLGGVPGGDAHRPNRSLLSRPVSTIPPVHHHGGHATTARGDRA